jgi:hypothetical protein
MQIIENVNEEVLTLDSPLETTQNNFKINFSTSFETSTSKKR